MRKSLEYLNREYVRKDNYQGLPDELKEFNYWIADSGHSIMAIPECLFSRAIESGNFDDYEVSFPVKYVLEVGYRMYKGYVLVDGTYSSKVGLIIDESYTEY